ncbi:hypothetical protein LINPERPRIM_LOCUS4788 [Linum perenne]
MISYTGTSGSPTQKKMMDCFQKQEVEASMLLSLETSLKRFMCSTRCWSRARGYGSCCQKVELRSMLLARRRKCLVM